MSDFWPDARELVRNINLSLQGKSFSDPRLSKIYIADAMGISPQDVDDMDEEDFLMMQWVMRRRNRMNKGK